MKLTIDTEKKTIKLYKEVNLSELWNWVDENLGGVDGWKIEMTSYEPDWTNIMKDVSKTTNKPYPYTTGTPLIGQGGINPLTVTY